MIPRGYHWAATAAGIKSAAGALDLALIVSDTPASAAAVYTTNAIVAAPVRWCRERTPGSVRGVVCCSGNANACTGDQGERDCAEMAEIASRVAGCTARDMLVLSTGVIGVPLPMPVIRAALPTLGSSAGRASSDVERCARALMTTDTRPKTAAAAIAGSDATVLGLAKGAGMIAPNMATMLGIILTDACLDVAEMQPMLQRVVDDTFNAIRIDGHQSTNDTVVLLANGAGGIAEPDAVEATLRGVATTLARAIPADGEGVSHLLTIRVTGAASMTDARRVARAIADSPLVKTAAHGNDPNWGRIISAAGMVGVALQERDLVLHIGGQCVFRGEPVPFDEAGFSAELAATFEVPITLDLGCGTSAAHVWASDLTAEYVAINSEYRT